MKWHSYLRACDYCLLLHLQESFVRGPGEVTQVYNDDGREMDNLLSGLGRKYLGSAEDLDPPALVVQRSSVFSLAATQPILSIRDALPV